MVDEAAVAATGSGPEETWSVSVDGTPRELTVREIAAEYRVGSMPRTAYVWRPGMGDWVFLPDAAPLRRGLLHLGLDLDETEMSMAKLADTAVATGPTSSSPPPPLPAEDPSPAASAAASGGRAAEADGGSSPSPGRVVVASPAPPPVAVARPVSDDAPSIVVDDGATKASAAPLAASPVPRRPPPRMSANPTVKLQRPPSLPRRRKSRLPIAAIALVSVIAVIAGATGYWLSRTIGPAAARLPSQGATSQTAATAPVASVGAASSPSGSAPPAASAAPASALHRATADDVMDAAVEQAQTRCRRKGEPRGSAVVLLSFLPSGRAAGVSLEGALAATSTGLCVIESFQRAKVPTFEGEPVAMKRDVHVR